MQFKLLKTRVSLARRHLPCGGKVGRGGPKLAQFYTLMNGERRMMHACTQIIEPCTQCAAKRKTGSTAPRHRHITLFQQGDERRHGTRPRRTLSENVGHP